MKLPQLPINSIILFAIDIVILIINTATTFKGGSVQVAVSFINECRLFVSHQYHVILSKAVSALIDTRDYPVNFHFYNIPYRPATRVFSFTDQAVFLKEVEAKVHPDVVFTTSGPAYWRPKSPHLMGFNLAHHLYPDSPFFQLLSLKDRLKWQIKSRVIKYYIKRDADAYVTQTDDINTRLSTWIDRVKVYTVTNTYGAQFDAPLSQSPNLLPLPGPDEKRFLMLSAYYLHKNLEIVNDIVKDLTFLERGNIRFVVTLPEDVFSKIFTAEARVCMINAGPQKPSDCPALYQECDFAFIPTLLECFSAAYPEAMKCGLPIVTTDLGFAHTVCGQAALFYKALDPGDALDKIRRLLADHSLQEHLIAEGSARSGTFLSARQRAERYLELCQNLAISHSN